LRDVGQKAKGVEEREHRKRDVCDRHAGGLVKRGRIALKC
jgi:hypothetical protein